MWIALGTRTTRAQPSSPPRLPATERLRASLHNPASDVSCDWLCAKPGPCQTRRTGGSASGRCLRKARRKSRLWTCSRVLQRRLPNCEYSREMLRRAVAGERRTR